MKKKAFFVGIVFAVAIMLLSIAPVSAAPKEKVDFALYFRGGFAGNTAWLHENGYLVSSPNDKWVLPPKLPPEGYVVWHYVNAPFTTITFIELVVGEITFPFERLGYIATISGTVNDVTGQAKFEVWETVTIYTDVTKSTVWGTIEMRAVSALGDFPTPALGLEGTFEGHGTGELDGVKVKGDSGSIMYGLPPTRTRARVGIAMGWP